MPQLAGKNLNRKSKQLQRYSLKNQEENLPARKIKDLSPNQEAKPRVMGKSLSIWPEFHTLLPLMLASSWYLGCRPSNVSQITTK